MSRYSGSPQKLVSVLPGINGASKDMVLVGTGSNEIRREAGMIASQKQGLAVCVDPTFQPLLGYAKSSGSEIIRVPLDENMNTDLDAMHAHVAVRNDTHMIYLVNRNNPVPSVVEKKAMRSLVLEMSEKCIVFVDEAYHEYVENPDYESMMELVASGHKNIIISRTASKTHGLAGLRVGCGLAHPDMIEKIKRLKTGDNNVLAIKAAVASYSDSEFPKFVLQQDKQSLAIVEQMCEDLNV